MSPQQAANPKLSFRKQYKKYFLDHGGKNLVKLPREISRSPQLKGAEFKEIRDKLRNIAHLGGACHL